MTEQHDDPRDAVAAAGEEGAPAPKAPAAPRYRAIAVGLAGAVLLVVAVVGTAPFWTPSLPWGPAPASSAPPLDPGIDRLDAAQQQNVQRRQQEETAASAALQLLDRRVAALEARPIAPADDLADLRRQVTKQTAATADLAARVAAIDKAVQAQEAVDRTDTALVLVLLQIRGAVAAGRPFAAEYEALAGLARSRPDIAAAAAPLAEPAKTGVAGRAVLAARLREVAGAIAAAPANNPANNPAKATGAASDWSDEVLSRLRGLVTIRRIDGAGHGQPGAGPEAAVKAAELALAGSDLDGAVAALDKLTGAPSEAARPWLGMAKERLAVEVALRRIEALLVARLGNAAPAPGSSGK